MNGRARVLDLDSTDFGFRARLGSKRRPLWIGPQRSGSMDAIRDGIREAAKLGVRIRDPERFVNAGELRGGAEADAAGCAWTDVAGVTYFGIPMRWCPTCMTEPCRHDPADPCTWLRIAAEEK